MSEKKKFLKNILNKSVRELILLRDKLRKELYELRTKNTMKALTQTHKIRFSRRKIAQVQFVLSTKIKEL